MSALRASTEAYIGVGTPVSAQLTRRSMPSAFRARWVSTCPTLHPGSRDSRRALASSRPSRVRPRRSVDSRSAIHSRQAQIAGRADLVQSSGQRKAFYERNKPYRETE